LLFYLSHGRAFSQSILLQLQIIPSMLMIQYKKVHFMEPAYRSFDWTVTVTLCISAWYSLECLFSIKLVCIFNLCFTCWRRDYCNHDPSKTPVSLSHNLSQLHSHYQTMRFVHHIAYRCEIDHPNWHGYGWVDVVKEEGSFLHSPYHAIVTMSQCGSCCHLLWFDLS